MPHYYHKTGQVFVGDNNLTVSGTDSDNSSPVDLVLARQQHKAYVDALRSTGADVRVLPGDEAHPDCVFVEDPAVVIGGTALITRPGAPSRRRETDRIKRVLQVDTSRDRARERKSLLHKRATVLNGNS